MNEYSLKQIRLFTRHLIAKLKIIIKNRHNCTVLHFVPRERTIIYTPKSWVENTFSTFLKYWDEEIFQLDSLGLELDKDARDFLNIPITVVREWRIELDLYVSQEIVEKVKQQASELCENLTTRILGFESETGDDLKQEGFESFELSVPREQALSNRQFFGQIIPNEAPIEEAEPDDKERAMFVLHFAAKGKEELTKSFVNDVYGFDGNLDLDYLQRKFPNVFTTIKTNDNIRRANFIQGIIAYTYREENQVERSVTWQDAYDIANLLCATASDIDGTSAKNLLTKVGIMFTPKPKKTGRRKSFSAVQTWLIPHRKAKQEGND